MDIKLSGWKALLAILLLLGFVGFRYASVAQSLDTDGRQAISDWIASEYQRYHLARTDLSDEDKAAILLQTKNVELLSLDARGKPELIAVRVEIAPNAAHPPGMPYIRYFRMEYSFSEGWY